MPEQKLTNANELRECGTSIQSQEPVPGEPYNKPKLCVVPLANDSEWQV